MSAARGRAALFLDRDGTIMEDEHYGREPARVRLIDGAREGIRQANVCGVPVIVVTNQSGIGRGMISQAEYEAVAARLDALLAHGQATIDATFYCPHYPERDGPCRCRKPGTLLYEQAAEQFGLDLEASVYVGDRARDVAAAVRFGGTGLLVPSHGTPAEERDTAGVRLIPTIREAMTVALATLGCAGHGA
ncbi:MAG: HAD family hydrolase [Gemmatimonadaceae bacterium]|jgi:histidinol-phosphate phosphatase family protein|nr:HAD family hydrolase [Gemmatimonadaceae bacterium]